MPKTTSASQALTVVMLLDNHYAPDPRVEFESRLLIEAGAHVRVIAWDRRAAPTPITPSPEGPEVVRINVPAPRGGGRKTAARMMTFARKVWRQRKALLSDADVLVVHDIYLLPLARLLSWRCDLPLVYDAHEEYAAMEGWRYPPRALRVVTAIESLLARRALAVVVPGVSRQERWIRAGFASPLVLRNLGGKLELPTPAKEQRWDLAYAGTLDRVRRIDILRDIAQKRPDIRVLVAGAGRAEQELEQDSRELANLDYLGWVDDPGSLLSAAGVMFYGLDPDHPYSEKACPNTLYAALQMKKPLIFFCGGEPARLLESHKFGIRCAPTSDSVIAALDQARGSADWEFEDAWLEVSDPALCRRYVEALQSAKARHREAQT
jgi:glycosyltransferase involved in cell wall biosynthesis